MATEGRILARAVAIPKRPWGSVCCREYSVSDSRSPCEGLGHLGLFRTLAATRPPPTPTSAATVSLPTYGCPVIHEWQRTACQSKGVHLHVRHENHGSPQSPLQNIVPPSSIAISTTTQKGPTLSPVRSLSPPRPHPLSSTTPRPRTPCPSPPPPHGPPCLPPTATTLARQRFPLTPLGLTENAECWVLQVWYASCQTLTDAPRSMDSTPPRTGSIASCSTSTHQA